MDPHTAYRTLVAHVYELAGLSRRQSDRDAAAEGATAAQWHVLSVLSGGRATAPQVARRLGQARQSVQRVVDDLRARGDVRTASNPDHARSPLLEITPAGAARLDRLWTRSRPARLAVLDDAGLTPDDLTRAATTLAALAAALRRAERGT
ncbi:MarR family winged helix-turn-helix transcriptional regulator [Pseudonocardia sp. CA-107938]|uniref:MarR family winged helix-turn-helix transcriptional regulator n=1 Tax=Pseudonocardia sp. CA-107938 TaxID=3240021 RepID=UPI003D8A6AFE